MQYFIRSLNPYFNLMPITKFLKSDGFIAGLILILFLLTNRYILGWDDQHLEIPLLKHLINPNLYSDDYYVESLKLNFSSYLYPLLARFITIDQIPTTYLTLYMVTRYFMFFWMYKIWKLLFQNRGIAFVSTITLFLASRTEELIYRTFSHQEFAYAIIFAGIYSFYRSHFILAAVLLGVSANVHFLYALFPMFYLSIHLLFFHKDQKWRTLLISGASFILAASPFLAWAIPQALEKRVHADPALFDNWIAIFKIACPYNFFFHTYPLQAALPNFSEGLLIAGQYLFIITLVALNWLYSPDFRNDRKTRAIIIGGSLLLAATFFFSYIQPSRFALDLNLIRNLQYLQWILTGYTAMLVVRQIRNESIFSAGLFSLIFISLALHDFFSVLIIIFCVGLHESWNLFVHKNDHSNPTRPWLIVGSFVTFIILFIAIIPALNPESLTKLTRYGPVIGLVIISAILIGLRPRWPKVFRLILVILPLIYSTGYFLHLHYRFVQNQTEGSGFWQLQREWEQMQHYVREHTPVDAKLLVPYNMEMGGFRIFSERSIVASYRDCGIVGFDYPAVLEWQKRIADIEPFKVFTNESILPALKNGIQKYNVDYIVFMRYYAPNTPNPLLIKIFENNIFSLFKVNR